MGCEGGICWVLLAEPVRENSEKLTKLLPWNLLSWDNSHDYCADGEMGHHLFMDEIPYGVLEGTYSNTVDDPHLTELNRILQCQEYIKNDWGSGEVKLSELLEVAKSMDDRQRRQREQWYGQSYKVFDEMLLASFEYSLHDQEHILEMTLDEWCAAVKACCKLNKYGDVCVGAIETWT